MSCHMRCAECSEIELIPASQKPRITKHEALENWSDATDLARQETNVEAAMTLL